jgi:hypothetical protein
MEAAKPAVSLPPLYYQENFEQLCRTVQGQYQDLLTEREQVFYHSYFATSLLARCLYVRLVSRRGPLFRREQLHYPELGDLAPCICELIDQDLVEVVTEPDIESLLYVLRKSELLEIYPRELSGCAGKTKPELQQQVVAALEPGAVIEQWLCWSRARSRTLLRPCFNECVEVMQLLFFGNRRQSLTDFVLSDIGVANYQAYPLDREFRLFQKRCEIDDYLFVAGLRDQFYDALECAEESAVQALVEPLLERGSTALLEQRRNRLRNRVARQLERYQHWHSALVLYGSSTQHPGRERRVRILHKLGEFAQALSLCHEMEEEPWCEAERDFLGSFIGQLEKKLGLPVTARPRDQFEQEHIQLPSTDQVEMAAAEYYSQQWQQVCFVENSLVNGVFGLAFWEQIFSPLPGAFVNPYQGAPLDMFTTDFYPRRRQAIEMRMLEIEEMGLKQALLAVYDSALDTTNHWVNWRLLPRQLLERALDVIPLQHWLPVWRRILFDPQANRSGFPDLVALGPGGNYRLIEIKGPGDQLQRNQKRWLRFFQGQGIPAQVTWITWSDG